MEKKQDTQIAMSEAPKKVFYDHYRRPEKKVRQTDTATMTVPTPQMTLREIKQRYAAGMPITGIGKGEMFFDDGNSNGINPNHLDFADVQKLKEETYARVQLLTERVKLIKEKRAIDAEEEVKRKKAALQDEIRDYVKKFGPFQGGGDQH